MDLKEINILGKTIDTHWYYNSKAKAVAKLLKNNTINRIVDIGAGSGFFSKYLLLESNASEAWCVDTSYKKDSDSLVNGKKVHFRRSIDSINVDTVLLMDVLEHVDDDTGLLKEYVEKVPQGTTFLISVPAFQFIYSSHDVFLEHKRRYRLTEIERVVEESGLLIKNSTYYFGAVFPIAVSLRIAEKLLRKNTQQPKSQLRQHNFFVNSCLGFLSRIELALLPHNRVAGLTGFCVAQSK